MDRGHAIGVARIPCTRRFSRVAHGKTARMQKALASKWRLTQSSNFVDPPPWENLQ